MSCSEGDSKPALGEGPKVFILAELFITIISAKIISNYYKAMHEVGKTDMLSAGMLSMFMHHINTKLGG